MLKAGVENTIIVDAAAIAENLGNIKAQNVVLLGALVKTLGLTEIDLESVVDDVLPAKIAALNKTALKIGIKA